MCGFHHKNQSCLELKIVLPIENGEEPSFFKAAQCSVELSKPAIEIMLINAEELSRF
jgi:hypothetical protein